MIDIVIEPDHDEKTCYGKYRFTESNIPDHWDYDEVDDLREYDVIDWRYTQL